MRQGESRIKSLRMRAPYARVIIAEDETVNIAEIMKPATPAPAYVPSVAMAAPGGPPPAETQVAIDTVSIETDRQTSPTSGSSPTTPSVSSR